MATDLETRTDQGEVPLARPSLKIVGLHIRGLKSITSLDLPEDGLGWDGPIPDFVMLGGINGSGKTTLLKFIVASLEELIRFFDDLNKQRGACEIPTDLQAEEARIDFRYSLGVHYDKRFCFIIGNEQFVEKNNDVDNFGYTYGITNRQYGLPRTSREDNHVPRLSQLFLFAKLGAIYESPAVVFFPSEQRTLISPETQFKFAGRLSDGFELIYRWQPPRVWPDSLAARLYAVRWEDLNAKEEGRPEEATHFRSYQLAFDRVFQGRRQLKWTPKGELVVETKSGALHDLSELSSGEKQVILFMGELLHRWRPGSLILIDEPELHLHESYQTKLWESLVHWQKERGGQVIVATQSGHLFRLASSAMKVLLSRQSR